MYEVLLKAFGQVLAKDCLRSRSKSLQPDQLQLQAYGTVAMLIQG